MKTKPMIMAHGNLILPLTVGQIIEQTEDYVKFETDSVRYCIDHYGREANVLALVA